MRALVVAGLLAAIPSLGLAQNSAPPANDLVPIVSALGPLANSLIMAISMDTSANGSIVFSTGGQRATFFGGKFLKDEGRQCANFADTPGFLVLMGMEDLGKTLTLAGWAKLPFPGDGATVWDGVESTPLRVADGKFVVAVRKESYPLCPYDKALTGWHHLAVTCDGSKTSFYIDGVAKGSAPVAIDGKIRQIGSATFPKPAVNSQCGLLDDMFIFNRVFAADELTKVAAVRLPMREPTAADLARGRPSSGPPTGALVQEQGPNSPNRTISGSVTGLPAAPAPIPPAASEATARAQEITAELVKTHRNNLVFVEGSNGSGSGFLAKYGNQTFLFTNAHVAAGVRGAGFKSLLGTPVQVGAASVAVGHDIFLMQATAPQPLEIMMGVDEKTSIGDDVVVLGNAEGAGVINTIMGKIVGVGPNLVEVDAAFKPGNSGSPIIHLKSGKVIGGATYMTIRKFDTATNQPMKEPIIRRFGYRLDSVKAWQPVQWPAFLAQAKELETVEKLTEDLVTFADDVSDGRVNSSLHTNPVIKNRIDSWLGSKSHGASLRDRQWANQNFISFLKVTCQTDVTAAKTHFTYDYFQRALTDQERTRTSISAFFDKILKDIQSGN